MQILIAKVSSWETLMHSMPCASGFASTWERAPAFSRKTGLRDPFDKRREAWGGKMERIRSLSWQTITKPRASPVYCSINYIISSALWMGPCRTRHSDAASLSNILYFCLSRLCLHLYIHRVCAAIPSHLAHHCNPFFSRGMAHKVRSAATRIIKLNSNRCHNITVLKEKR